MYMKKTISIGIPAYNEEANIGHLINSLLKQKGDNFVLKEIIVVSDASTDKTDDIVRAFLNEKVILIRNNERQGQGVSQNKIIKKFSGDILLLLNADVLPANEYYIQEIIKPFYTNSKTGLVSSPGIPLPPKTFFEKVIHYGFVTKLNIFDHKDGARGLYLCHGMNRAFLGEFAKKIKWPTSVGEDAYSYLRCMEEGYLFQNVIGTGILFKLPDNFADHLRQSVRHVVSKKILFSYFSPNLVKREYGIPLGRFIKAVASSILKHPVLFSCYSLIFVVTRIYPRKSRFDNSKWEISKSSKILIKEKPKESYKSTKLLSPDMQMENKSLSITVGIPTYEASASLVVALHSIYSQTIWDQIAEVLVVVDGNKVSEDVLQKIANPKLKLSYSSKQEGQSARINDIVQTATGDLVVLTNDDVILRADAIEKMFRVWQETGSGLLAGHVTPLPARGYLEEILEIQNKGIYKIINMLENGDNYLACNGRLIALSSDFAKSLKLPSQLKNNDAYIFISSKIQNIKFMYVPEAVCYFRNPSRLNEYFKQSTKFQSSLIDNSRFLPSEIEDFYQLSKYILVKAFLAVLIKNPIKSVIYILLKSYAGILSEFRKKTIVNQSGVWEIDKSTKSTEA